MDTNINLQRLLKQQVQSCLDAYLRYYAGSIEDHAPECVIEDITNSLIEPIDLILLSNQGLKDIKFMKYEEGFLQGIEISKEKDNELKLVNNHIAQLLMKIELDDIYLTKSNSFIFLKEYIKPKN